jgi:hypothetical protein
VTTQLLTLAFERPAIDWHAVAPELTLLAVGCLITLIDIIFLEKARPYTATLAGLGVLATAIPIQQTTSLKATTGKTSTTAFYLPL